MFPRKGKSLDRGSIIERSLFSFIWKYSKRDQVVLLIVTLFLFPLLFLTLELPKRIINDAIGNDGTPIELFGFSFGQIEYLWVLCGLFLLAVLCHGLLKMRINTMKGVLAERLLRRFRYTLIARVLRFPQPYFERTSQGELVSMVTAESEPMGGLMGDALAQPVLQAGQMLTILGFLFAQSITFGLAACALIPLQAWLIPKLQRQVNLLNRKRVLQVRRLAAEIGETATGASTLRAHGGWRRRLAVITDRLGRLFLIRFDIYQKKFFMKFINNFITQMTPFLFYAIGGYLVIQGEVTIGALVAALAAYKDLSGPWKELLAYYNQSSDMQLRWETITDRFAPVGMIDEDLMTGVPESAPHLTGDICLERVTVRDADGNSVLDRIDTVLPGGALIGVAAPRDEDRRAFAELLTREVVPSSGVVRVGEDTLNSLHQVTIARRIGHANSRPVLFEGSFGDNLLMPLRSTPVGEGDDASFASEAERAGNSIDMMSAPWGDDATDENELIEKWCDLMDQIGGSGALLRRGMDVIFDPDLHSTVATTLVDLRPQVAAKLAEKGLDQHVCGLNPAQYCVALPVVQNLLYATPRQPLPVDTLVARPDYVQLFRDLGLTDDLVELALAIMDGLRQIFGATGTGHPLFQKTGLDPDLYDAVLGHVETLRSGRPLSQDGEALLLSVPSSITAEQVGPAFPDRIRDRILSLRDEHGAELREKLAELFAPIDSEKPVLGFSILENLLFGKISEEAGPQGEVIRQSVVEVLREADVSKDILKLVFEVPVGLGGANLPASFAEPLAVSRAAIKSPDILVLDDPMTSFSADRRLRMINALRAELPEATLVILDAQLPEDVSFELRLEIQHGRLIGGATHEATSSDSDDVAADLARKLQALEQTALFSGLERKQLRLLAFGARWYRATAGSYVFHKNDAPDSGAFMMIEGEADLLQPSDDDGEGTLIATVGPGTLVGELGLIRNEPRALDMRAKGDILCLRIGVEEFLAVVENDAATAFKLLQVVAGYVNT